MKKKNYLERYFNTKIWNILYFSGFGVIAAGAAVAYLYWGFLGLCIVGVGVVMFLLSTSFRITEKDIDACVAETKENYGRDMINGKYAGKRELNAKDFKYFSGFIRDKANVRFKSGRDGKIRTSRYYITAICVDAGGFVAQCSIYDLFGREKREDSFIALRKGQDMNLTAEKAELPRGNVKYTAADGSVFWLADDALADDLISRIRRI